LVSERFAKEKRCNRMTGRKKEKVLPLPLPKRWPAVRKRGRVMRGGAGGQNAQLQKTRGGSPGKGRGIASWPTKGSQVEKGAWKKVIPRSVGEREVVKKIFDQGRRSPGAEMGKVRGEVIPQPRKTAEEVPYSFQEKKVERREKGGRFEYRETAIKVLANGRWE